MIWLIQRKPLIYFFTMFSQKYNFNNTNGDNQVNVGKIFKHLHNN